VTDHAMRSRSHTADFALPASVDRSDMRIRHCPSSEIGAIGADENPAEASGPQEHPGGLAGNVVALNSNAEPPRETHIPVGDHAPGGRRAHIASSPLINMRSSGKPPAWMESPNIASDLNRVLLELNWKRKADWSNALG
jgi:hypothetical protein